MSDKKTISKWERKGERGSKRTHITESKWIDDWFVGFGKEPSCQFEGTWWDMICFARNILANENTKIAAPEYYKPEWRSDNYTGEDIPYEYNPEADSEGD